MLQLKDLQFTVTYTGLRGQLSVNLPGLPGLSQDVTATDLERLASYLGGAAARMRAEALAKA